MLFAKHYTRAIAIVTTVLLLIVNGTLANAANSTNNARQAVFLLLLGKKVSGISKPVYEDAANIAQLSGDSFGAMGDHPVRILSINNPGYPDSVINKKAGTHNQYYTNDAPSIRLKIDLFYPADSSTARPTVFFISGYRQYHSEQVYSLLYFIASHGYNAAFVSYQDMDAANANHVKNILEQLVADPLFSERIDTSKVGFTGHSLAGGLLFHLANELATWGNNGRFIFTMAGWHAYFQDTKPYTIPANTSLIVQTYNEELNNRPDEFDTDPRFSIDYLTSTTISNSEKTYLYLPGDAQHPSNHSTPKSKYNRHGNKQFYFDALQQVGIFRPLQSIMRYSFNEDTANKAIGLPESSAVMRTSNGIAFYSGDNPYVDLGMRGTPLYNSDEYGFPYGAVTMASDKMVYDVDEDMTFHLEKMEGNENDWVGIFPAGVTHEWGNEVAWRHTGGFNDGSLIIADDLLAGDYEAGAFFNDSLDKLEAKVAFSISN